MPGHLYRMLSLSLSLWLPHAHYSVSSPRRLATPLWSAVTLGFHECTVTVSTTSHCPSETLPLATTSLFPSTRPSRMRPWRPPANSDHAPPRPCSIADTAASSRKLSGQPSSPRSVPSKGTRVGEEGDGVAHRNLGALGDGEERGWA